MQHLLPRGERALRTRGRVQERARLLTSKMWARTMLPAQGLAVERRVACKYAADLVVRVHLEHGPTVRVVCSRWTALRSVPTSSSRSSAPTPVLTDRRAFGIDLGTTLTRGAHHDESETTPPRPPSSLSTPGNVRLVI